MKVASTRRAAPVSRRAWLQGAATVVGLPFLESLLPTEARAAASAPKRLIYYYVPNGINMASFRPSSTGSGYALTPILKPLEAIQQEFSVVTGLENAPARPDGAGDHASGTSAFITCTHALKSETTIALGISADQIAAQVIGKATRLPSLQLGTSSGSTSGGCDSGYSCAYTNNISWAGATTPLPKLTKPQQVFDEIFKGFDPGASRAEAAKRRAYSQSVLDSVVQDATALSGKLGRTDVRKLDEYLTGVRELERRLEADDGTITCVQGARPAASYAFPELVDTMSDLMVLAMRCDATRIITFMLGNAGSQQTYPQLNITRGHHDISHHGNDPTNLAQLEAIATWEMQRFAYLLTKMKSVTEGGTNMLFNSTVFLSSDISDGNRHNHDDMPILLAGHGGGALNPGRHIAYAQAERQRVANLLSTMLGTVGVTDPVGNSSQMLTEL